jgi:ABC-2 type transport system ATP-binding protein
MEPAIEARGLARRFGPTVALEAVDLMVGRGEIFGVVGPNGAGKTSLLQLLASLAEPSAGTATVLGYDVRRAGAALRQRIGYVSQDFTLYGALSVEENLDFFATLYRVPEAMRTPRKDELLAWSRLTRFRARRAGRLSGGMQKKLHLCSTLIHQPEVLLLDEPTTGVDPVSRRELWEILHDLAGRGLTLVVATPYMDEAEQCDRVALIYRGRIRRCDTPDALRGSLPDTVWELRTETPGPIRDHLVAAGLRIRPHLVGGQLRILAPTSLDVAALLHSAPDTPAAIETALRRVSPTMEDVFVSAVSQVEAGDHASGRSAAVGPAPTRPDSVAVRLEGLTRRFGDFTAVENLSLTIDRGEVFGFLGPNGSGKTTTIRILCGLLRPSAGRGVVLGHDLGRETGRLKARVGYMSQRFSLYNDLTVAENLAFFGGGYGVTGRRLAERTAWVLEMARLKGQERRRVGELPGGVKQHLALGCAILHEPEVIFLDEPTAGVDPIARRDFWDLIARLAASGMTVFVTTHYLDEAENCHRIGLMYEGRLVAVGRPQDLKTEMRAGVMLELACPEPFRALRLLRAQRALNGATLFGRRLHLLVDDPGEADPAIRSALEAAGITVERLEPIPLSLEDLFVIFIDMVERDRAVRHG